MLNLLNSLARVERSIKISPEFLERGKERTLVGLSLPREVLLSLRETAEPTKTNERS